MLKWIIWCNEIWFTHLQTFIFTRVELCVRDFFKCWKHISIDFFSHLLFCIYFFLLYKKRKNEYKSLKIQFHKIKKCIISVHFEELSLFSSPVTNMGLFAVIFSALLLSGKLSNTTFKIMIIYEKHFIKTIIEKWQIVEVISLLKCFTFYYYLSSSYLW